MFCQDSGMNSGADAQSAAPSIDEQQAFYDKFWGGYPVELGGWEVRRLAAVLDGLSEHLNELRRTSPGTLRICDFGCGRGWLAGEMTKFGNVVGVDLSPEGIDLAQKAWPNVRFEVGDVTKWRPGYQFDLVVSSEVLEHIVDKRSFVETVCAILRPGGYAILTTPNKRAQNRFHQTHQIIEDWTTTRQLKGLFSSEFVVLRHETFVFDFSYEGLYRITSAPKLLQAIGTYGLRNVYDGLRKSLHMGLYQLLVAKKR
jgi:SAM-dependent methyltransferase